MSTLRTNAIVDNAGGNTATINGALAVNTTTLRTELNATGSAPIYACRAWVNFNGTGTPAIRASGNVSSITDNGVGDYTINFTTAMPDANYACLVSQSRDGGTNPPTPVSTQNITSTSTKTSSAVRVGTGGNTGAYDATEISVAIFR